MSEESKQELIKAFAWAFKNIAGTILIKNSKGSYVYPKDETELYEIYKEASDKRSFVGKIQSSLEKE